MQKRLPKKPSHPCCAIGIEHRASHLVDRLGDTNIGISSSAVGGDAEILAADFLGEQGLKVLFRNYRCRHGEIDLVALEGETLCFIEVRFRRTSIFGAPVQTVGLAKRRRIIKTATHFLAYCWTGPQCACRFDIVTLEGQGASRTQWWRGAFDATS